MSSRNPFRLQNESASSSSQITGNSFSDSPKPNAHNDQQPSPIASPPIATADIINEDLPPAYTSAPDPHQGEETLEYGPTRPFQNPPPSPQRPVPPQHPIAAQSTGWSNTQYRPPQSLWQQITGSIADQITGSSSRTYPVYSPTPQPSWTPQYSNPAPPPLPPRPDALASPISPTSPTSDFARDFYAAGPHIPGESSQYLPPSGPPPAGPPKTSDDDGRPTKTPVPGHPLLNGGKLLVYPPGYECHKCHNVGYKQNDPSHPCRKCWQSFAKPFTGVITYSSFKSSSAGTGKTFQRPLPLLRPPQAGPSRSGYPGSSEYARNIGAGQNSYSPLSPSGAYPPNVQMVPYSPYGSPQAPPGSVVYRPGDPRLGGRLCYRCAGDGVTGGFLSQDQCYVCGGVGRLF